MESESNPPKPVSLERALGLVFGMIVAIFIFGEMAAMTTVDNLWSPDWSKFDWLYAKVMLAVTMVLYLLYRIYKKLGWGV